VADFIGEGLGFPVRTDPTGGIALVRGSRDIEESIYIILGTTPGERPMRPAFGCAIHELVFAPVDATTFGTIASEVRQSLRRWEPRIDVTTVDVVADPSDPVRLSIDVGYVIKETNDPRNLVFPFYTIPRHG
jgi:phage baseplate assembly protein W